MEAGAGFYPLLVVVLLTDNAKYPAQSQEMGLRGWWAARGKGES